MHFKKSPLAIAAVAFLALPLAASAQSSYAGTSYSGTAPNAPVVIPAVNFDKGGEGVAYHDLSAGNLGGKYRSREAVDIYASKDTAFSKFEIANFQNGEWLNYTVNVPASGNYDLSVRASNNLVSRAYGAFHLEVDGVNVTGTIRVPVTGSWNTYQWFGKKGVALGAGQHVVKLVSETQWFNVTALSIQAGAATPTAGGGTPYAGTPVAPATFPAVNYDKGGEGVAYHDLSSGNLGGLYRTAESVDIYPSLDSAISPYKVQNFQTGEWMNYTIDVPTAGNYDLGIRSANNLASGVSGAFHIEVDGLNATGTISVPITGDWDAYQWFGKKGVPLTAGKHVLKLVSEQQWFDVSAVTVLSSGSGTVTPGPTPANAAPTVSITSPASGQSVSGTSVAYAANASDDAGVARVQFFLDGSSTAILSDTSSPYGGTLNSTSLADGTHTLRAVAYDAAGLSSSSQLSFNVQNSPSGSTGGSGATPATPLWFAGMEAGNMLEWYKDGGGEESNGSDSWVEGNGLKPTVGPDGEYSQADREQSHTGSWSAKLGITASQGGVRLWRWKEANENRELYYSTWYFVPQRYTVGSGGWNNMFQFKSVPTGSTSSDPFFILVWNNTGANGAMRGGLQWWNPPVAGPLPGQSGKRTWMFPADIPVGRWFNVEIRYVCAGDFTGAVQVWQDGVEMINLEGIRTRYPDGRCSAAVTNYAQNISPLPYEYFVDDVVISRTRVWR